MTPARSDRRWFWMSVGLAAGLAIAWLWPHEHAAAVVADRNDKFAVVTAEVDITQTVEGVFVLDFLTGQLRGAVPSPQGGGFAALYGRNVAADFQVNPNQPGNYAIVSARLNPQRAGRGAAPSASMIYVAELNSGKVIAYTFPVPAGRGGLAELTPAANFQFREAVAN
jgi:hypothetical protein